MDCGSRTRVPLATYDPPVHLMRPFSDRSKRRTRPDSVLKVDVILPPLPADFDSSIKFSHF
jgi:hypothetical protein